MSNRLRELREAKTLTKTALAEAVGVSRQALHALEAGASVPGVDVALRLAAVLGVTVEELVIPRAFARDERVERLVDVLSSGPFRRELSNLGGYFTSPTGSVR